MRVDVLRFLPVWLAGTLAAAVPPESQPARSVEALAAAVRDSVVVIDSFGRDGTEEGVGAGFVVSTNGLIATCFHVIGEGRPVRVRMRDGARFDVAEITAWDRDLDLALIRVEAAGLKPLPLGDSDDLNQGAEVVAMGNPMGLEHSIVQGVMSARREVEGREMLQLAIPIEPGNSGGPLLDLHGRAQGLLNMKSALTRNLGFAIPINTLKTLLAKPNPVPMNRWLTIGALNPKEWQPLFGARWKRKGGRIQVEEQGTGFGGRSLCLSHREGPARPYEIAVTVKLGHESGAAGLVFGSDGAQRHYGFYPTAGSLRLTRFDGPEVFSWTILETVRSDHYKPGDWNTIKVRWEKEKILCSVNGHVVIESDDEGLGQGRAGLAKFRDTKAEFKDFQVASNIREHPLDAPPELAGQLAAVVSRLPSSAEWSDEAETKALAGLQPHPEASRALLEKRARQLEGDAETLRRLAARVHQQSIQDRLVRAMDGPEASIDLLQAALLLAKLDIPDLDIEGYRNQVAEMAGEISSALPSGADELQRRQALLRYLFEENGFHGSRSDYYNAANSHINRVLDDREGLPITLSLLFLELASRIGLTNVAGVPLPGHFVVRHSPAGGEEQLLDIFEGGKAISLKEAEEIVFAHSRVPLRPEYLQAARKKDILIRMIRNLRGASQIEGGSGQDLRYLDLLLALAPDSAEDHLQRAGQRLRQRDIRGAKEDLKWLLEHQPAGADLEAVAELYQSLDSDPPK